MVKQRNTHIDDMTSLEKRAVMSLASIYALRMLGLFMIMPVFAIYATGHLVGATPALIGLAIGAYGLTNAIFQIPFGMISDRFGRKPIIIFGLVLFAAGSVVSAMSDTIWGVIIGRIIQGCGAIAAVVMALTADLTREEHRLKAMAVIGMSIGASFAVALIMGPILDRWIGVQGIFWLTAILALGGIGVIKYLVPDQVSTRVHRDSVAVPELFRSVLRDHQLLRLDFGIMALHMILTATFVVVPLAMLNEAALPKEHHWYIYLPVLLLGMALMIPFIIIAEKKRKMKTVFVGSIAFLGLSELVLYFGHDSIGGIFTALAIFFIAFNVLEASLPSLVAKVVMPDRKGTAMGVYNTSQFLGAFMGGVAGGLVYGAYGMESVFLMCVGISVIWFWLAFTMQSPRYLSSYLLRVAPMNEHEAEQLVIELTAITGVAEAIVNGDEGVAYLKVDLHALDKEELLAFSVQ